MFQPLKKLLPESLNRRHVARGVQASQVIDAVRAALDELMGKEVAAKMRVKSFRNGEVKIACDRSVYAQEATLHSREIIERANERLDAQLVTRIRAC